MIQTLLGRKIEQTQKFLSDGTRVPVTQIAVPDNIVLQIKTIAKDKYNSLQVGIVRKKKSTKALLGHAKKAGLSFVPDYIREIKLAENQNLDNLPKVGEVLKIEDIFKPGDIVKITGLSKGKGFAGVVKRHNFRGGPKTHGQSDRLRAPGSIGQTTTPGRVYKGKRMAGRMGNSLVAIKNLKIVEIDSENKKLSITGLVPGAKNSIVSIHRTGQMKKFIPLINHLEAGHLSPEQSPASLADGVNPQDKTPEKQTNPAESKSASSTVENKQGGKK